MSMVVFEFWNKNYLETQHAQYIHETWSWDEDEMLEMIYLLNKIKECSLHNNCNSYSDQRIVVNDDGWSLMRTSAIVSCSITTPLKFFEKQTMSDYYRCNNYVARKVWFCVSAWAWRQSLSYLNCLMT